MQHCRHGTAQAAGPRSRTGCSGTPSRPAHSRAAAALHSTAQSLHWCLASQGPGIGGSSSDAAPPPGAERQECTGMPAVSHCPSVRRWIQHTDFTAGYLLPDAAQPWQPPKLGQIRHVAHAKGLKDDAPDVALCQLAVGNARVDAWYHRNSDHPRVQLEARPVDPIYLRVRRRGLKR